MDSIVTIIVFAPLVGALIAGLFGRKIGNVASQAVTTGGLFLSAILSWYVFINWLNDDLQAFTVTLAKATSSSFLKTLTA